MRSAVAQAGFLAVIAGHVALANPVARNDQIPLAGKTDSAPAVEVPGSVADLASAGHPAPQACRFTKYTALGDSYACGFGAGTPLPACNNNEPWSSPSCSYENYGGDPRQSCGKNQGGYPWQFWDANRATIQDFRYLACNGNDTGTVLRDQLNGGEFGEPDLVTINFGGDDQSWFADVASTCLDPRGFDSARCDGEIDRSNKIMDGEVTNIDSVFSAIKTKAPGAMVVVMSYAQLLARTENFACKVAFKVSDAQYDALNQLAIKMNALLESRTKAAGFHYVNVDPLFDSHRFCDSWKAWDSWFQLPVVGKPGHPTLEAIRSTYLQELRSITGC